MRIHNRESFYRVLWENVDRNNFLTLTQQEVSKLTGISYQAICEILAEFTALGRVKKYRSRFQLSDPNCFQWGDAYESQRKLYSQGLKEKQALRARRKLTQGGDHLGGASVKASG